MLFTVSVLICKIIIQKKKGEGGGRGIRKGGRRERGGREEREGRRGREEREKKKEERRETKPVDHKTFSPGAPQCIC